MDFFAQRIVLQQALGIPTPNPQTLPKQIHSAIIGCVKL
jgi:hypothetical protein